MSRQGRWLCLLTHIVQMNRPLQMVARRRSVPRRLKSARKVLIARSKRSNAVMDQPSSR